MNSKLTRRALDEEIIEKLAKNEVKLEIEPGIEFAQKLEKKLLIAYEEQAERRASSWIERIRNLFSYITHMKNTQKIAFAVLTLAVIGVASYATVKRSEVVQALQGIPQKVRDLFVPHVDKEGNVTYSTSTKHDGVTFFPTSTPLKQLNLKELVDKKLVEVILEETIEGEKITGVRYADGDWEVFVGDKGGGHVMYDTKVEKVSVERLREGMRKMARNILEEGKLSRYLEDMYKVSKYSSIDELVQAVPIEIVKELPSYGHVTRSALVRFPDGTQVGVSEGVGKYFDDKHPEGVEKKTLSFNMFDASTAGPQPLY